MTHVRLADRSNVPLLNEFGSQTVDALQQAAGRNATDDLATTRAAHTFGSFASGSFVPSHDARDLCSSELFQTTPNVTTRLIMRLTPFAADKRDDSKGPYGMALRLTKQVDPRDTPTQLDVLTLDLPRFVAKNRVDFLAFAAAINAPHKFLALLVMRRVSLMPIIRSKMRKQTRYTDCVWNGQNTFWITSPGGIRRPVRHRFRISEPTKHPLVSAEPRERRLARQLAADLSDGRTLALHWDVVDGSDVAHKHVNDPTKAFPKNSPVHRLGTITLDSYRGADDDDAVLDAIGFNPLYLGDGITASDDPLLKARAAAMPESQIRRAAARSSKAQ